jgi:hypothetical protein
LQKTPDAVWTEELLDRANWNLFKSVAVDNDVPATGKVKLLWVAVFIYFVCFLER